MRPWSWLLAPALTLLSPGGEAAVERHLFTTTGGYLVVELLDDDLAHFEAASGPAPGVPAPIYTSPMVLKTDHAGPSTFQRSGTRLETADLRLEVNAENLCVAAWDRRRSDAYLTTVCPVALASRDRPKGIDIDPGAIQQVYGLGQEFKRLGSADGDWLALGVREGAHPFGNALAGFDRAATGNVQIPIYYAAGEGGRSYALFMDNVYWQRWDFEAFWWQARMYGDHLRWYLLAGPDLPDLRADYMELTGRPPVPPRKAFGLWVSEFGYDSFGEIDALRDGLRQHGFPVDGFVLDLNWFGGITPEPSSMGRLDWDQDQNEGNLAANRYSFRDPGPKLRAYADDRLALCAIEESYLADTTATFAELPPFLSTYRQTNGRCDPANQTQPADAITGFWGRGRMLDWSDPAAGAWIHDRRRFPNLARLGLTCHWTDLGEPETFDASACYEGVERVGSEVKNRHPDLHNLHNLLWNRSIWQGYAAKAGTPNELGITNPRPLILTRSGAAGIQRYGAAMWSGDIASSTGSLATHMNAQVHMSFSGIDYYGADVGGFRREVLPFNDDHGRYRGYEGELYTQWLANAAWLDVPVRPHVDNEFKPFGGYETAPHLVGHVASNLANLRQRYELIPYYYSLAHLAFETGAPVFPPPVFYHQDDPSLRGIGHEKMIGRDLLVGIVARHGEYERDIYLPAGRWADYHSQEWVESTGRWVRNLPVYRDGIMRLPAFARAGAVLPKMHVDADTQDAFGHRRPGAPARDELIVRVHADATPTSFTLYEDDGTTLRYVGDRPAYPHRRTPISQRLTSPGQATVTIGAASDVNGPAFAGAIPDRPNVVELVVQDAEATGVTLDGASLPAHGSRAAFDAAASGWLSAGPNLILAKSDRLPVGQPKTFTFTLRPKPGRASVYFVCDSAPTQPGRSIFITGSLPELGGWDPGRALKLEPSVYWQYIVDGMGGRPVWTRVVPGLPPDTAFAWKCLRLNDDRSGTPAWQPGADNSFRTAAGSGYSGRAYGRF